jgi:hypothetical protein
MKTKRDPIVMIVVAVVIAAVGFVAGMQVQKHLGTKTAATPANGFGGAGGGFGGGGGFRRGGGGTFGQVTSINGTTSMVVQNSRTGTNTTVSLSGNPTVTDAGASSSLSAIATGDTVIVRGTTASDGTVAATSILINPSFGGGGGSSSDSSGTQTE